MTRLTDTQQDACLSLFFTSSATTPHALHVSCTLSLASTQPQRLDSHVPSLFLRTATVHESRLCSSKRAYELPWRFQQISGLSWGHSRAKRAEQDERTDR